MITEYLNTVVDDDRPWASKPDSEENILRHLAKYTLDPVFERYGDFVNPNPQWLYEKDAEKYRGCAYIFGNFLTFSHAFRVVTDNPDLIQRLTDAINRNKATPEYKAARERMIEQRIQEKKRREQLIHKYGNYIGHESPH